MEEKINNKRIFRYIPSIIATMILELDLKFNPIMFDWEGNKKDIKKDATIKLTSTPIFLLKSSFLKYELYLILFVLFSMF